MQRLRVFVNERPVEVARGATVRDAVTALDRGLGELVATAAAYVTDGVGRRLDPLDPVGEAGGVFRVVVTARRSPGLSKEALRRWPKAELHVHLDGSLRPATTLELAQVAVGYRSAGVVGFDLAGAEHGHPARDHGAAFALAARHGLACTCHAGEGDGPGSIHQALHACGAQRIGHGTRLGEDPALLDYVVERAIPLEMCLSSNLHTHTVTAIAEHPFKRYLERGVVVTLNTDGRLVDGISLTDEYFLAHSALGLSRQDLTRVTLNACQSAFLPEYEKVALVSRVQSELEAL